MTWHTVVIGYLFAAVIILSIALWLEPKDDE